MQFPNSGTIFDPYNDSNLRILEKQSLIEPEEEPKNHKVRVTATIEYEFDRFGLIEDVLEECTEEAKHILRKCSNTPDTIVAELVDEDGEVIER